MNEEDDSKRQIEQFKLRIKKKSLIHHSLLRYLGISADEMNQNYQIERKAKEIYQILIENNIPTNKYDFREFLETISHLGEMHLLKKEIKYKIENLLTIMKEDIKSIFSEKEIFAFFHNCESIFIILILVEQNFISVETIINNISLLNTNDWNIIKFFYPEIRKHDWKYFNKLMMKKNERYGLIKFVEENDQNLEFFYENRKEGEKEPKIIELIREDKIEEFITFVEHYPIDLNKIIILKSTIFSTKNLTPIDYSALFGSIRIFKYLYMKEIDINVINKYDKNNSFINYAVQGRNYEIIHLLEERKEIKDELNKNQQKYLKFTIKMHYNEIFEYFMTNFNIQVKDEIIYLVIFYRNYQLLYQLIERNQIEFKDKTIISNLFHGICINGNEEIVKLLINQPNININSKDNIFDK